MSMRFYLLVTYVKNTYIGLFNTMLTVHSQNYTTGSIGNTPPEPQTVKSKMFQADIILLKNKKKDTLDFSPDWIIIRRLDK